MPAGLSVNTKERNIRMTLAQLRNATRAQLIRYLESWGFQCYDHETTAQLRVAAIENFKTEAKG